MGGYSETYAAVHQRLQRLRTLGTCLAVGCGRPAEEWALRHDAESRTIVDPVMGLKFSNELDDYVPLCRRCHRAYDGNSQTAWDRDHAARAAKQARGERHGRAKLTADQVAEIRFRRARGEVLREIAEDYGVSIAQVSRIALGQTWGTGTGVRMRLKNTNGFTLIELMVVVAIIGILASIAIPAFMKNAKKAKTTEATINIKKMSDGAVSYYHEEFVAKASAVPVAHQFPDPAGLAATAAADTEPAVGACCGAASPGNGSGKCIPVAAQWAGPAWQALKFSMDDPHYYSYMYSHLSTAGTIAGGKPTLGDGSTPAEFFFADAIGDLNCDGVLATFEVFGGVDGAKNVSMSAGHSELNPLE